jgi:hypothetical protein
MRNGTKVKRKESPMARKPAPALIAALLLAVAFGVCPWDGRGQASSFSSRAASTWGTPFSEQGIACPIDHQ